jgi:transposase InsO family protein
MDICAIDLAPPHPEVTSSLQPILDEFQDVFSDVPATTTLGVHQILTPEDQVPIALRPRRTPLAATETLEKELDDMLAMGIIRPSTSPWNSPIVVVPKKDGALRFCIDFRGLNKVTQRDPYGMPSVDELRDRITGAKYFSNIDLTKCYWQFAVDPKDIPKTAFTAGRGHWEFAKMPFGLRNAPATCQRGIDACFRGLPFVIAYMDDILIFSRTKEEHPHHVKQVLQRIRQYNLRINRAKSHFGVQAVKFLGHQVSEHGVQLHPENLKAIEEMQPPRTKKELERFLGLGNYFAKFLPNFARIAEPLFTLKRKHARNFAWLPQHQAAFAEIKDKLIKAPTLLTPVPGMPYFLAADASDVAIGASLEQAVGEQRRPVAFVSRLLDPTERKRSAIDREALAILWACDKFEPYLLGAQFYIESDHEPLKWLYETPRVKGRLSHWQLRLAAYDGLLGVNYVKGSNNVVADCLSRPAITDPAEPRPASHWHQQQIEDARTEQVSPTHIQGICTIDGRFYLPVALRQAAIKDAHGGDRGLHFGVRRTAALIRQTADWPGLLQDVVNHVNGCKVCQAARYQQQPRQPLQPVQDPHKPNHTQCMDIAGPFPRSAAGNRFLLIIVDVTSRFLYAYPLVTAASSPITQSLLHHFHKAGYPALLVADNARAFQSREIKQFCRRHRIQLRHTTPYRPTANGLAERAVRTIKEQLRAFATQFPQQAHNWDRHVPRILAAYNTTPHRNTGFAPQELISASPAVLQQATAQSAARRQTDRQARIPCRPAPPILPGTQVFRRLFHTRTRDPGAALRPRWDGPFVVVHHKPPTTYTIVDPGQPTRRMTVHRDLLRPTKNDSPNMGGHAVPQDHRRS